MIVLIIITSIPSLNRSGQNLLTPKAQKRPLPICTCRHLCDLENRSSQSKRIWTARVTLKTDQVNQNGSEQPESPKAIAVQTLKGSLPSNRNKIQQKKKFSQEKSVGLTSTDYYARSKHIKSSQEHYLLGQNTTCEFSG